MVTHCQAYYDRLAATRRIVLLRTAEMALVVTEEASAPQSGDRGCHPLTRIRETASRACSRAWSEIASRVSSGDAKPRRVSPPARP